MLKCSIVFRGVRWTANSSLGLLKWAFFKLSKCHSEYENIDFGISTFELSHVYGKINIQATGQTMLTAY